MGFSPISHGVQPGHRVIDPQRWTPFRRFLVDKVKDNLYNIISTQKYSKGSNEMVKPKIVLIVVAVLAWAFNVYSYLTWDLSNLTYMLALASQVGLTVLFTLLALVSIRKET